MGLSQKRTVSLDYADVMVLVTEPKSFSPSGVPVLSSYPTDTPRASLLPALTELPVSLEGSRRKSLGNAPPIHPPAHQRARCCLGGGGGK